MYDALLEALKAGNTAIPCSEFRERFEDLCQVDPTKGKSKLQEQFEVRFIKLLCADTKSRSCRKNRPNKTFQACSTSIGVSVLSAITSVCCLYIHVNSFGGGGLNIIFSQPPGMVHSLNLDWIHYLGRGGVIESTFS